MACRDAGRGEQALKEASQRSGSDKLALMLCDLGSLESVRNFAAQLQSRHQTLDVLINNAGVITVKRGDDAGTGSSPSWGSITSATSC